MTDIDKDQLIYLMNLLSNLHIQYTDKLRENEYDEDYKEMSFIDDMLNEEPLCNTCKRRVSCDIVDSVMENEGDWSLLPSECDYYEFRMIKCCFKERCNKYKEYICFNEYLNVCNTKMAFNLMDLVNVLKGDEE